MNADSHAAEVNGAIIIKKEVKGMREIKFRAWNAIEKKDGSSNLLELGIPKRT